MSSESSDKTILRSPADWPRWFANIRDQAKYEQVWDYINPDAVRTATDSTGTATGSPDATGTATTAIGDTGTVTTTTATLPSESSISKQVSDALLKMQLEIYRRWEKKIKAIKSLDNLVI